jgi:hypothetical protein
LAANRPSPGPLTIGIALKPIDFQAKSTDFAIKSLDSVPESTGKGTLPTGKEREPTGKTCRVGDDKRLGLFYLPAELRPQPGIVDYGFCRLRFAGAVEEKILPLAKD